jgi:fructokinase
MSILGLATEFVQQANDMPTGIAGVSHDAAGDPSFTILRPAAYDSMRVDDALLSAVAAYDPQWIYFGTLFHTEERNESLTRELLRAAPSARHFYDMNLRPKQWDIELVHRLCSLASILKLNEQEVRILAAEEKLNTANVPLDTFSKLLSEKFNIPTICITLGARGCFVYEQGTGVHVPGHTICAKDTVGAGDAFSAAFLHGHERGLTVLEAARFANTVGAIVASRSGATPLWTLEECHAMSASSIASE